MYNAVQQKAIDGREAQHSASYGLRVYEVLKYINKTAHFQLLNGLIVGEKWFSTLPASYQALLLEEFEKQGKITAAEVIEKSDVFEGMMVKEGMEVVEVDLAAFKKASEAAYDELGFAEQRKAIYKEIGKE